ncbi:hypothetical protein [Clostridium baratii]|nr:hypothetical protein [Clostridium baratii]CUP24725.1 Uncharacterised protein [Clostridium baratii]
MNLEERVIRISKLYKKSDKETKILVGLIILGEVKPINKKD